MLDQRETRFLRDPPGRLYFGFPALPNASSSVEAAVPAANLMRNDQILIEELELRARLGFPDEERAQPQRLTASLVLEPRNSFRDLDDDLGRTIDYAAVCAELQRFVSGRQDQLLETLANKMAEHLLQGFALARVELELRKFILPETKYVAVRVARSV